jgi:hypothetical protein
MEGPKMNCRNETRKLSKLEVNRLQDDDDNDNATK